MKSGILAVNYIFNSYFIIFQKHAQCQDVRPIHWSHLLD